MKQKQCRTCSKFKDLIEFFKDKGLPDGHANTCKECKQRKTYEWRERNKDKYNAYMRQKNKDRYPIARLQRYNLTPEQHAQMLLDQEGVCAIPGCGGKPTEKRTLAVDHDHVTKEVLGLLCYKCNRDMNVVDDREHLAKLISYRDKNHRNLNSNGE